MSQFITGRLLRSPRILLRTRSPATQPRRLLTNLPGKLPEIGHWAQPPIAQPTVYTPPVSSSLLMEDIVIKTRQDTREIREICGEIGEMIDKNAKETGEMFGDEGRPQNHKLAVELSASGCGRL